MNNKKKLIRPLMIISFLSISLFALTNSNEYKTYFNSELDEKNNEKKLQDKNLKTSQNINDLNKNVDNGLIFPENNVLIYNNRFTQPLISLDSNNPGFMGIVQSETNSSFHSKIMWSGENLISQWSYDITKHPDIVALNASNNNDFVNPIILGGIHSDNGKTNNFINQLLLLVGDESNLTSKKFAIIRYDTISGTPIINTSPIVFSMTNSPNPTTSTPYALTMTYDQYNDRYIVYYPGAMKIVASDMKSLKINSSNQLSLENNPFSGISTWPSNADGSKPLFNEDNYILAIKAVPQTRDGSGNLGMIIHNASFTNDIGTFANSISILELKNNLAVIDGWSNTNNYKIAKSDSNNYLNNLTNGSGEIIIERNSYWDYFNPHMATDIIDANTYTSSIILPVKKETNIYSMRLVFIRKDKFFDNKNSNGHPLSNVNFNNSVILENQQKIYNVWYNQKKPLEYIITTSFNNDENSAETIKYTFPKSNFTQLSASKPIVLDLISRRVAGSNLSMSSVESYNNENLFYTSWNNKSNEMSFIKLTSAGTRIENYLYSSFDGSLTIANPFENAKNLNWLAGQSNQKKPSQITDENLFTTGDFTKNNLFSRNYLLSLNNKYLKFFIDQHITTGRISISPSSVKNDVSGTISGNLKVTFYIDTVDFEPISLIANIPFSVSGFARENKTTILEAKNKEVLKNTLPSDITNSNAPNFFSLNNLPLSVVESDLIWNVSEANNSNGLITISVKTPKWYENSTEYEADPDAVPPIPLKTYTQKFELKNIPGTQLVRNSISIANLTVWDINSSNIVNYVNFTNTISGFPILASYSIENQNGIAGTLDVTARITGGYYDPNNNALPNPNPSSTTNSITLKLTISGFSKILGATSIETLSGNSEISPSNFLSNPSALLDYVRIINSVPGSIATIENIRPSDNLGSLIANLIINKTYNANGTINNSPKTFSDIQFEGFKLGAGTPESRIVQINNLSESSLLFPEEINALNINIFTKLFNIPSGAEVTYSFSNKNNVSINNNGGSLDVTALIKPGINEKGENVPEGVKSQITLTGLKSVKGETRIVDKDNQNSKLYPQFVLIQNISNMIEIENGSEISNKITQIKILDNSFEYDNLLGKITVSYEMSNYFDSNGRFYSTTIIKPKKVSIFGFKTISGPTTLVLKENASVSNVIPKDFDVAKWNEYFKITNTLENTNFENVIVEKIGFDNSKGIITLKISNILNYINSDNKIIYDQPGEFIVNLSGFKIFENTSMIFIVIGGTIGGLILLIIILLLIIYIFNKNKNKKILFEPNIKLVKNNIDSSNKISFTPNKPIVPPVNQPNLPPQKINKDLNKKEIPKIPPKKVID